MHLFLLTQEAQAPFHGGILHLLLITKEHQALFHGSDRP